MEWLRLVGALALWGASLPVVVPLVEEVTRQSIGEAQLSAWNPGNLVSQLVSYAMASLLLTGLTVVAQKITFKGPANQRKILRETFWWMGSASGLVILFYTINYGTRTSVNPTFGFLLAVSACSLVSVQLTRMRFPEYAFDPYIRGTRLESAQQVRRRSGKRPAGMLPWGADFSSRQNETKHFLLFGNVGGGKTTYIKIMMSLIAQRSELWVVFDPKTELVPFLNALGKKLLILNPLDRRSVAWDLSRDINNPSLAEAFALMIVPDAENSDIYWTKSARNLLVGLIVVFILVRKEWSLRDIILACSDINDLMSLLQRHPNGSDLIATLQRKHEGGSSDYLLTLNSYLRPFHVIASLWEEAPERFSLTELFQTESFADVAIVLGADYAEGNTVNELNRLIFERIVQLILNLSDDYDRRIILWLDEVSEASRYLGNSLVRFLTLARSKGGCAVLGMQNKSGIVDRFGEDAAQQILGIPHHKAIVGGVDGQTAEWFSREVIGEVELIETEVGYSQSFGASDTGVEEGKRQKSSAREVSPSHKRVRRLVVPPEELLDSQVPKTGPQNGLTGFFAGGDRGFHWHHYEWAEVEALHVTPDKTTKAYDRIDEQSDAYYLKPWTAQEREALGLPPKQIQTPEGTPPLGEEGGNTLNQNFSHKPKR